MRPKPRLHSSLRVSIAPALAIAIASACAPGPEGPTWTPLARDAARPVRSGMPDPATGFEEVDREDGRRVEVRIPREAWEDMGEGRWKAHQPVLPIGRPGPGVENFELRFPDAPEFTPAVDPEGKFRGEGDLFAVVEGQVRLLTVSRADPPGDAILSAFSVPQIHAEDGRWIVSGRRIGGEGFALRPGESIAVTCDVRPESALRFGIAKEAMLLGPKVRLQSHTIRVWLEGSLLFEEEIEGGFESVRWRTVPLPRGGGRGVHIRFQVEGPPTYAAILDPQIIPVEIGNYAERPFERTRRDVVFFLADTFRADNLSAYGATDGRAPNLDRLADESLVFQNMHSVATHTLPTHATFFSGLFPRQNGLVTLNNPLPEAVDTLAEYLSRSGFRTVAITDGVMVSQSHGMAQGFGWFDERRTDMDGTVERVRDALAADDGRPLFLFIQSYASHTPYLIRESTRELLGERWSSQESFDHWFRKIRQDPDNPDRVLVDAEGAPEAIRELATLYAAAVFDLDRGFGEVRDELQASGILRRGTLLVASDHGESFGEHDWLFHTGIPYEELVRVPLLLHGPGIEPGIEARPASLIDIAPTIAQLAGLPPLGTWAGRSLLAPAVAAPLFAFQCRGTSKRTSLAVLEENRKLIGYEDVASHGVSRWLHAFDLAADPNELDDLLGSDAGWPDELGARMEGELRIPLTPIVRSEDASLSADQLRELDAMGYGGESKE
ncbi:MAG TPA: hypothetical protein ENJ09_03255 [Planctomycetes bacterium]|nr:hypothetical protein [Planctomycetota bacterium]